MAARRPSNMKTRPERAAVGAETGEALRIADEALAQAMRLVNAAADAALRNGDGDLATVEDVYRRLGAARHDLNAY